MVILMICTTEQPYLNKTKLYDFYSMKNSLTHLTFFRERLASNKTQLQTKKLLLGQNVL